MNINNIKKIGFEILKNADIYNIQFEISCLICEALNISKIEFIKKNLNLNSLQIKKCVNYFRRRADNEPLQYIIGKCEFMSLMFKNNNHVLIPRQDTETLVQLIIKNFENKSCIILDIGTGSGCIAASLAYYLKNSFIYALDVSDKALNVAKENFKNLGVENKIKIIKHDILKCFPKIEEKINIVVSNPPYIESENIKKLKNEIKNYEPTIALDGGSDGLVFYKKIISGIDVDNEVFVAFEVGFNQAQNVKKIMEKKLINVFIKKDLSGFERVVMGTYKPICNC
ncbi:MAG: peptide chain release factor N(5)-glutamine methyltransferase [Clostridiales bacterium]|jgi:release factor glutamine methyltransferase|nr:peptide chain release factor N(5)-glutamine methyltransferase [Clostridiales bacterium]